MLRRPYADPSRLIRSRLSAIAVTAALVFAPSLAASADETLPDVAVTASEKAPAQPVIADGTIGEGTYSLTVRRGEPSDGEDTGPTDTLRVILTSDATGEVRVQQRETDGELAFAGLAPGLYGMSIEAHGPGGVAGKHGFSVIIPDTSAAPIIDGYTAEQTGVILRVRNVNDAIPPQTGPTAQASVLYHLTLDDGTNVHEIGNSASDGTIGYFNVLTPGTTYTATVTVSYFSPGSGWFGTSAPATTTVTTLPATDPGQPGQPSEPAQPTPPATGETPQAPSVDDLVETARGGVVVPATASPGQSVTVSVGSGRATQTLNGWLFSSPISLGGGVVDAAGRVVFTLPDSVPAGAHRLAVTDAEGAFVGWGDLVVSAPSAAADEDRAAKTDRTALAATGSEASWGLGIAAALLILAGLAVRAVRGRTARV